MGTLAFCPKKLPKALANMGLDCDLVDECVGELLTAIVVAGYRMWEFQQVRQREIFKEWSTLTHVT